MVLQQFGERISGPDDNNDLLPQQFQLRRPHVLLRHYHAILKPHHGFMRAQSCRIVLRGPVDEAVTLYLRRLRLYSRHMQMNEGAALFPQRFCFRSDEANTGCAIYVYVASAFLHTFVWASKIFASTKKYSLMWRTRPLTSFSAAECRATYVDKDFLVDSLLQSFELEVRTVTVYQRACAKFLISQRLRNGTRREILYMYTERTQWEFCWAGKK